MTIPYNPLLKPPLGTPLDKSHRLARGLVGCWLMNENGGTTVFDLSGNVGTGTFQGTTPSWVGGKFGPAVDLPGTDERIDIGNIWNPTGQAQSLSFLIYPETLAGSQYIFLTHLAGDASITGGGLLLAYDSAPNYNIEFIAHTDNTHAARNGINILTADTLQHIVLTWDGSLTATNIHIYKNGSEIAYNSTVNGIGNFTAGTGSHSIGGRIFDNNRNFDARFDNMYWWNRILSASEIVELSREPFIMFKDPNENAIYGSFVTAAGIVVLRRRIEAA